MLKIYNISDNGHKLPIDYTWFKFPGGEVNLKITDPMLMIINGIHIETDLINSDEVMLLLQAVDVFRSYDKYLDLLYTPYARQDRQTSNTESFSFRVFANIINSCGFKKVTVCDPHSDVTPALINNIFVKKRLDIVSGLSDLHALLQNKNTVIVSPDAGALKTNNEIAKHYKLPHISATKVRDTQTGEISHTRIHALVNETSGRDLIIMDDICDGGRTFIEIAKVLQLYEAASLSLYVTVGIFSQGIEVLQPYFANIFYNYRRLDAV